METYILEKKKFDFTMIIIIIIIIITYWENNKEV